MRIRQFESDLTPCPNKLRIARIDNRELGTGAKESLLKFIGSAYKTRTWRSGLIYHPGSPMDCADTRSATYLATRSRSSLSMGPVRLLSIRVWTALRVLGYN
jgi:hypothetical protein